MAPLAFNDANPVTGIGRRTTFA